MRVKVDLEAAGLSAVEAAEAVGPERFAKVGRVLLAIRKDRHLLNQESKAPKTAGLLQIVRDIEAGPLPMHIEIDSCTPAYERARPSDIRDEFAKRAEVQKFINDTVRLGEACRIATSKADFPPAHVLGVVEAVDLDKTTPYVGFARRRALATIAAHTFKDASISERNRKAQRAGKKIRTAAKKRRGW